MVEVLINLGANVDEEDQASMHLIKSIKHAAFYMHILIVDLLLLALYIHVYELLNFFF